MPVETSTQSSKALVLSAFGLIYLYFALSVKCLISGLPGLVAMSIFCTMEVESLSASPRLLLAVFFVMNLCYWISSTSYVLYPVFSSLAWGSVVGLSLWRFQILRQKLAPMRHATARKIHAFEARVNNYSWPVLDFDGRGILAIKGSTLDLANMSFTISGIDVTYEIDQYTKVVAKLDTVSVRLARDVKIGELYLNVKGDGIPASELMSFSSVARTTTAGSIASSTTSTPRRTSGESVRSVDSTRQTPIRKLPPMTPPTSVARSTEKTSEVSPAPSLPPRLPPRSSINSAPGLGTSSGLVSKETDLEEEDMRLAIEASMRQSSSTTSSSDQLHEGEVYNARGRHEENSGLKSTRSSLKASGPSTKLETTSSPHSIASDTAHPNTNAVAPDTSFFYPESEETDNDFMQAAFEEGAINHSSDINNPELNGSDMKAAIAASLADQASLHSVTPRDKRIRLSQILARIPWWLRIDLGPLITRVLLSVVAWSHPIRISSIAASGTGKRITNLMETGGLKKAHPNQEIFRLIRKVFLWLESGDISIILSKISIHPHIPISSDHDIMIDVKASEPTAYRNVTGVDDVLAKIDGIKGSFRIPTFLLPNHESQIPKSPRSTIPFSISLSLPGVFNRELLTIGAAFVKATTMMDLRHTAQNRAPPTLPSLSGTEKFSFKSFGLAVKQAAGDLAKQKGVQWGVRDAELAKWTAKFARLMRVMKVDIGGAGEIPVDLYKLRRRASLRGLKKQQNSGTSSC